MGSKDDIAVQTIDVARAMKKNPKRRNIILTMSGVILASTIVAMNSKIDFFYYNNIRLILMFITIASIAFFLPSVLSLILPNDTDDTEKISKLLNERVHLERKTEDKPTIFDLIRLNLNRLDEYYTLNIIQAKNSYRLSTFSVIFGMIVISFTIIHLYNNQGFDEISIVSAITGIITEFIGATSIMLYKESIKSINTFHNKLSKLQNIMVAIELTEKLEAETKDTAIVEIISSIMAESDG